MSRKIKEKNSDKVLPEVQEQALGHIPNNKKYTKEQAIIDIEQIHELLSKSFSEELEDDYYKELLNLESIKLKSKGEGIKGSDVKKILRKRLFNNLNKKNQRKKDNIKKDKINKDKMKIEKKEKQRNQNMRQIREKKENDEKMKEDKRKVKNINKNKSKKIKEKTALEKKEKLQTPPLSGAKNSKDPSSRGDSYTKFQGGLKLGRGKVKKGDNYKKIKENYEKEENFDILSETVRQSDKNDYNTPSKDHHDFKYSKNQKFDNKNYQNKKIEENDKYKKYSSKNSNKIYNYYTPDSKNINQPYYSYSDRKNHNINQKTPKKITSEKIYNKRENNEIYKNPKEYFIFLIIIVNLMQKEL